ncbi:peptidoglycan-binding domain-containing protein [uncultured Thiodictyon sp.]|uniref:peptidoglycan-binding domain-containing protein n=1 Tax=uncultured Thiodictyon sp. TaxID=1846217 RepID=UPI0025E3ED14|nr:peptidoglycan-binding domain-containing protein [uncultured Thiodictyon sp.]
MADPTPPADPKADHKADPKADPKANPFQTVALLLQAVRTSLDGVRQQPQAPRWVRIARIRGFQSENDYISTGVIPVVEGFIKGIGYLAKLTLDAKDLLFQADAAKALVEVSAALLTEVTKDEFYAALLAVAGQQPASNPLSDVGGVIAKAVEIADKVPSPEDLKTIGKELFLLLRIDQRPLNEQGLDSTTQTHLEIATTGKLRLLSFALDKPFTVRGLGRNKAELAVTRLGSRRVWEASADKLPVRSLGTFGEDEAKETVFDLGFADANAGKDIAEANALLETLGYTEPAVAEAEKTVFGAALARRLRRFQKVNGLPITGALDVPTINGLLNLDSKAQDLVRSKPYDATVLTNFNDSKNPTPPAGGA